jgi:hypothetical protein
MPNLFHRRVRTCASGGLKLCNLLGPAIPTARDGWDGLNHNSVPALWSRGLWSRGPLPCCSCSCTLPLGHCPSEVRRLAGYPHMLHVTVTLLRCLSHFSVSGFQRFSIFPLDASTTPSIPDLPRKLLRGILIRQSVHPSMDTMIIYQRLSKPLRL